jgi:hypothetical protein
MAEARTTFFVLQYNLSAASIALPLMQAHRAVGGRVIHAPPCIFP